MALTNSLNIALTGLKAASIGIDVAGNNIANVNTTAFKKSDVTFEAQIARTLRPGSAPSGVLGGTNPAQVGLGVGLGSITQDFSTGSMEPTGSNTDAAVEGNGFFIVADGNNQRYTRNGNFSLDRDFNLVAGGGAKVQGWNIDDDYNVVEGVLDDVNIPIGVLSVAEPTTEVKFAGNLNAGGELATQGSITQFPALFSNAGATVAATAATTLAGTFLADGSAPLAGGDVITFTGATRGGADVPDATFEIGAANTTDSDDFGTTVQDLMDFLDDFLGIDQTQGTAGVTIDGTGVINVESNVGEANSIAIGDANFVVNAATVPTTPFSFTQAQDAIGESARTSTVVYDSLGNTIQMDLSVTMVNKDSNGTQWRYFATSSEDTDIDKLLGTGLVSFNTEGELLTIDNVDVSIDRVDTGADTPLTVGIKFRDPFGAVTALVDNNSTIASVSQDGQGIGTLVDFDIAESGEITGVFSNGLLRTLGQLPLATFANNEGLSADGGWLYQATANSGAPVVVAGGTGNAGSIVGRTLELSNVELSEEFVELINMSTGYSANSRVIQTADRLLQELLATLR
ncbi:MAG: flagellar hook-basal body complex protein [Planctomycetota bacterium]